MTSSPKQKRSVQWQQEARSRTGGKVLRDERLTPSASIYHYLEYPHALSIFSEDRLRLGNPRGWQDPYESWWNRSLFGAPDSAQPISTYALCWSRSYFDEPAWRMGGFQRDNPIIRVRCLVRDIVAAAASLAEERAGSFFV